MTSALAENLARLLIEAEQEGLQVATTADHTLQERQEALRNIELDWPKRLAALNNVSSG